MPTPPELALIGMIGAVEWVIDWVERQSTAMKLGVASCWVWPPQWRSPQFMMHGCGNGAIHRVIHVRGQ
jgi:hypothetical protein